MNPLLHRLLFTIAIALFLVGYPISSIADNTVGAPVGSWSGLNNSGFGSQNWGNADNWYSNYGPNQGAKDLEFGNNAQTTSFNDLTNLGLYDINFYDRGSGNNTTFTLNGNALTLYDYGSAQPNITNHSFVNQIINLNVTFSTNSSVGSSYITTYDGNLTFNGSISLSGTTTNLFFGGNSGNTTFVSGGLNLGSNSATVSGNENVSIGSVVSGSGSLIKQGSGTLTLNSPTANTYTGATTIAANGGTLTAGVGTLLSTSSITVSSGGTLLLSGLGDHIGANTPLTLAGGTFNTGGVSEGTPGGTTGLGALTLTANSTIDFGPGSSSIIQFAGLGPHTPLSGPDLSITNWTHGIGPNPAGTNGDALYFSGLASSFTTQYDQSDVIFNGAAGYAFYQYSGYYEIVGLTAVPEPSTWAAAALALGLVAWTQRRRRFSRTA